MKCIYRPFIKDANRALAGLSGSNEAGEPVPDIKVETSGVNDFNRQSALSNDYGHYAALFSAFPGKEIQVVASGMDSEKNDVCQNK
jgi:hypothetical protein